MNFTFSTFEPQVINVTSLYSDSHNMFESTLLKVVSFVFIVIGALAAIMNFSIFSILVQKKKKMASELLVVVNLIIDGCYGLVLVVIGILNVWEINLDETFHMTHLNCMVSKVPSSFLIFASLFLVLIVALNRYMAVKHPVK